MGYYCCQGMPQNTRSVEVLSWYSLEQNIKLNLPYKSQVSLQNMSIPWADWERNKCMKKFDLLERECHRNVQYFSFKSISTCNYKIP